MLRVIQNYLFGNVWVSILLNQGLAQTMLRTKRALQIPEEINTLL